jgi:probable AcnD-accessory protein PrpF
MNRPPIQRSIPALYMRGGTSKGVFFLPENLPSDPAARDAVLLRVMGSPDPYEKQIDGMGAATSSTSKIVIVGKSSRPGCDVDYLFGQVSIDTSLVDWSGNCGNLTSAIGPFAIHRGLVDAPRDGIATITIWQANISKKIVVHIPMRDGQVVELGDFELDGVTFPAAEIKIEFLDPGADDDDSAEGAGAAMFPTGRPTDVLDVPGVGKIEATLINAGNPAVFVAASSLGLSGAELQDEINGDAALLARCEAIRAHATVAMGLTKTAAEATATRQHTPKLAFFSLPTDYLASSGKMVRAGDIDIVARILSMGKLHHAMTGTGAVAVAAAAAVPGTVISAMLNGARAGVRFGHPSGALTVGAEATEQEGGWKVTKVSMSRSARRLMEGVVYVPETAFGSAA